ncbi:MAG: DsbA family protein [Gammaproteobacteria bacterium]|nr:DsbA family protein [Gammaproteobacteria bacterium]
MWRRRAPIVKRTAFALSLILLSQAPVSEASRLAARVDGKDIPLTQVDQPSLSKVNRIRTRLVEVARAGLERLVDRQLGVEESIVSTLQIPPISEAEIDAFRRERLEDFEGAFAPRSVPPEVEREAIRFFLQSEARKAAEARIRTEHRAQHRVEILVPEAHELEFALQPERVVARVDDKAILASAFESELALRLYRLRGELYLERRRNLERRIDQHLLEAEAQRREISLAELEDTLRRREPVSNEELEAFIAERRAKGQRVTDPERARPYLAFKKAYQRRADLLARLRASASVRVYLQPPARPRFSVDTPGGFSLGSGAGPTLVVFTNYRCRPCRATHRELDKLLGGGQPPQIILRDFVPVYDPVATEAAAVVRCAAHHGAFARVRARLLAQDPPPFGQTWFSPAEFEALAQQIDISAKDLRACANSASVRSQIQSDTELAQRLGFDQAPSFLAEGLPLSGMQTAEALRRALDGRWP